MDSQHKNQEILLNISQIKSLLCSKSAKAHHPCRIKATALTTAFEAPHGHSFLGLVWAHPLNPSHMVPCYTSTASHPQSPAARCYFRAFAWLAPLVRMFFSLKFSCLPPLPPSNSCSYVTWMRPTLTALFKMYSPPYPCTPNPLTLYFSDSTAHLITV